MLVANDRVAAALDASGLYSEERNLWLCEQVPEELRLVEFSHRTLPDHPAFRWKLTGVGSWRGFDLYSLPEPMQREFAYCFWQIIESGLTINPNYSQLVWWLIILGQDDHAAEAAADALAGGPLVRGVGARARQDAHEADREARLDGQRARDDPSLLPASGDRL